MWWVPSFHVCAGRVLVLELLARIAGGVSSQSGWFVVDPASLDFKDSEKHWVMNVCHF